MGTGQDSMAKGSRRRAVPKMREADLDLVLRELDGWRRGERPGRLTWARLEGASGFTRQALATKPEIMHSYAIAKAAQRGDRAKPKAAKPQAQLLDDLRRELDRQREVVRRYDEQWTRWVRNASLLGYDVDRLDAPIDPPARAPIRVVRAREMKEAR
jgi:hypothetical protein